MNEPLESRQRKMRQAYSVSNTEADDTEAQVEPVSFVHPPVCEQCRSRDAIACLGMDGGPMTNLCHVCSCTWEPCADPPLSPSDLVWRQGFLCGCLFGLVALAVTVLSAWLLVKAMDAGFWWAGKLLGGG